jgi:hypothetical protein
VTTEAAADPFVVAVSTPRAEAAEAVLSRLAGVATVGVETACVMFGVVAPGVVTPGVVAVDKTAGEEEAFGCVAAASLVAAVTPPGVGVAPCMTMAGVAAVGVALPCEEIGTPGAVELAVDGVTLPCVAVVVPFA